MSCGVMFVMPSLCTIIGNIGVARKISPTPTSLHAQQSYSYVRPPSAVGAPDGWQKKQKAEERGETETTTHVEDPCVGYHTILLYYG
jgi:hypothetical protein